MDQANRLIGTCKTCRVKARVEYEPGCTFSVCNCGHLVCLPDWQPSEVAREFNARFAVK